MFLSGKSGPSSAVLDSLELAQGVAVEKTLFDHGPRKAAFARVSPGGCLPVKWKRSK